MPRGKPAAKEQPKVEVEETKPEELPHPSAVEDPEHPTEAEQQMDNLEKFVREVVTQAIQPYFDRLSSVEERISDLELLAAQPPGAVQFAVPPQPENVPGVGPLAGLSRDDDVPEYRPTHQETGSDGTPWLR